MILDSIFNFFGITKIQSNNSTDISTVRNTSSVSSSVYVPFATDEDELVEFYDEGDVDAVSSADMVLPDVEELQTLRNEAVSNRTAAQAELSDITSGNAEEIAAAIETMDNAYSEYQDILAQEAENNTELQGKMTEQDNVKTSLDENSTAISETETSIFNKTTEISEQEETINGFESALSTLEAQLSAIPADSTEEGSEEANAQLQAQRDEIQHLIDLKKEEIELGKDKLTRLETEKTELEEEQSALEEERSALEAEEAEIQGEILELTENSQEVQDAQSDYNEARNEYEKLKDTLAKEAQAKVETYAAQVEEYDAQIVEAKNRQYEQGNYEITGDEVVMYAKQYEGLNNDEMKQIMEDAGAQFDDGNWCADFMTFVFNQVYYDNSTIEDYNENCEYTCRCSSVAEWGSERGITTTDSSEIQAGDAIIINRDDGGLHIGIVESVNEDGTINTIEGNTLNDDGEYVNNGEVNTRVRSQDEVYTFVVFSG